MVMILRRGAQRSDHQCMLCVQEQPCLSWEHGASASFLPQEKQTTYSRKTPPDDGLKDRYETTLLWTTCLLFDKGNPVPPIINHLLPTTWRWLEWYSKGKRKIHMKKKYAVTNQVRGRDNRRVCRLCGWLSANSLFTFCLIYVLFGFR